MEDIQKRLDKLGLEAIIGLETHIELNTKTKMFCACPNDETSEPNTFVCEICSGQIGTMPEPNADAIKKTVTLGLAIEANVLDIVNWDRKHYEYPDLPKGYQLTQVEKPIVVGGTVVCHRKDGSIFEVALTQIHLEEDAGKLVHKKDYTLVDLNRAGRPLIEIVTQPVLHNIDDTIWYLESLQKLVRALDISYADMEKGHLRSDVSISLRKKGTTTFNERTEIKNINSFKFAREALSYEINQQIAYWEEHGTAKTDQVTALWDEQTKTTKIMRTKENANDYRYIKEPDIPSIDISSFKKTAKINFDLLPFIIEKKLLEVGIKQQDATYFSGDIVKARFLFDVAAKVGDLAWVAKTLMNTFSDEDYTKSKADTLANMLIAIKQSNLSGAVIKDAIRTFLSDKKFDYTAFIQSFSGQSESLYAEVDTFLAEKADVIQTIKNGEIKLLNVLIGDIMKLVNKKIGGKELREYIITKIGTISSLGEETSNNDGDSYDDMQEIPENFNQQAQIFKHYRTHKLKHITDTLIGQEVCVTGWAQSVRDHGDLVFIDLREDDVMFQIKFDRAFFSDVDAVKRVKKESVLRFRGVIEKRSEGDYNTKIASGNIELNVLEFQILSESLPLPFDVRESKKVGETQRMKYRFLDLRNEKVKDNIVMRHKVIEYMRSYFGGQDFLEIETPLLGKGTDEGSREFIIPSRTHAGSFYTLPQSPQQLKQMLMVSGFDKYFQIARCFRDEDDRGDRQPEFTQVDLEMAFVTEEEVRALISELLLGIVKKLYPHKKLICPTIPLITYQEAMDKYGTDKPDLRFGLEMKDITDIVKTTSFNVFKKPIDAGGIVKAIKIDQRLSKTQIENLTALAQQHGLGGLAYIIIHEQELQSPIVKFLGEDIAKQIVERFEGKPGETIFFSASDFETTNKALDVVRRQLGKILNLYDEDTLAFEWVIDFPMFEKTDEGRWKFTHNPFSMPKMEHLSSLLTGTDVEHIHAQQYDIVLNGNEIGGGSIRAHLPHILKSTYKVMGYTEEEIQKSIGHMLKSFAFGTPPHGGLALGLDRIMMILQNEKSIREVIAFPKTGSGEDLLFGAPSHLSDKKLKEANIKKI